MERERERERRTERVVADGFKREKGRNGRFYLFISKLK